MGDLKKEKVPASNFWTKKMHAKNSKRRQKNPAPAKGAKIKILVKNVLQIDETEFF